MQAVLCCSPGCGSNVERDVRCDLLLGPPGTVSWRSMRPPVGARTGRSVSWISLRPPVGARTGRSVSWISLRPPVGARIGKAGADFVVASVLTAVGVAGEEIEILGRAGGDWAEDALTAGGGVWLVGGGEAAGRGILGVAAGGGGDAASGGSSS